LTPDDLNQWPADVVAILNANYGTVEADMGVNAIVYGPLTPPLKTCFQTAVGTSGMTVHDAPMAVQSRAPEGVLFAFDKFSSANLLIEALREDAARDSNPKNDRSWLFHTPM
jgi:hypothetical protein